MFKQFTYAIFLMCMGGLFLGGYLFYHSNEWLIEPDRSSWVCTKSTVAKTTVEESVCLQWTKVK